MEQSISRLEPMDPEELERIRAKVASPVGHVATSSEFESREAFRRLVFIPRDRSSHANPNEGFGSLVA